MKASHDFFNASNLTLTAGGDSNYVDVTLHSESFISSYQVDIILPECINVPLENGHLMVYLLQSILPYTLVRDTKQYYHSFVSRLSEKKQTILRVLCYSSSMIPFNSKKGKVFRIYLKADKKAKRGTYDMKFTNIVFGYSDCDTLRSIKPEDCKIRNIKIKNP